MIADLVALAHAAGLTGLLAVASSSVGDDPEYSTLAIALLVFFGILDRMTRNAWHNRELITMLIRKLIEMRDRGDNRQKASAQNLLRGLEMEMLKASREKRGIFAKLLKRELMKRGEVESDGRLANLLKELARYLPIIGRFF